MKFIEPLKRGKLLKRYKRFLADIELENGEMITAHCPNSGSMKTCWQPGWEVRVSYHDNASRKYPYTWEMVHNGQTWIGVNTGIPNRIALDAIRENKIKELTGYSQFRREVPYGKNSRIDIFLQNDTETCYVEVKNVTLVEDDGGYYFPDSVTERGRKHLYELIDMVKQGHRSVMFYVIQRGDGNLFRPATHIDPAYAAALKEAVKNGVEIIAYRAEVSPEKIEIVAPVPWELA